MVTELTFPSVTVGSVPFTIQAGTFPARSIIRQYAKRQNQTILEKVYSCFSTFVQAKSSRCEFMFQLQVQ